MIKIITAGLKYAGQYLAVGSVREFPPEIEAQYIATGKAVSFDYADLNAVTATRNAMGDVVGLSAGGERLNQSVNSPMNRGPIRVGPRIPPTLTKNIAALSDTVPTDATETLDSVHFKTGSSAVRITANADGAHATVAVGGVVGTADVWGVWVYVHNWEEFDYIQIWLGQGGSGYGDSLVFPKYYPRFNGWHYIQAGKDGGANAFTLNGAGDTAEAVARAKITAYAEGTGKPSFTIDSIYSGGRSLTDVMIIIDDGESSAVTQTAFTAPADYCAGLGIPVSLAIFGAAIAETDEITPAAKYSSVGMLRRAYYQGHEIVVHGQYSYDSGPLGTYEKVFADIQMNRNWILNHGFVGGENMLVYPTGSYGQEDYIDQAVADSGILMAREVYRLSAIPDSLAKTDDQMMRLWILGHNALEDTVAEIKAAIDGAIAAGMHIAFMFHKFDLVGGATANDCSIYDFWEIADYLATKQTAGLCQCVTMSEFYARRQG